ncbi:hypothetical protein V6N12_072708 [Hibiscus sabdariffa]|uniref:Uncharacterized protein n=1 Tax=Hibiscus sabdariffa TaxID=183260 RepID=A0ABR2BJW3_9ROSI
MAEESQQSKMVTCRPFKDDIIGGLIEYDFKAAFIRWIHYKAQSVGGYDVYQPLVLEEILCSIEIYEAVKCATAILRGETGLKIDIKVQCDIIASLTRFNRQLPLNIAIKLISEQPPFIGWFTRQSLYMTLVFCLCETEILDNVRLLFRTTNEVEKEIYRYMKDGKLIEIAALLTVAREEVTSPSLFKGLCDTALNGSMTLRQLVSSEIVSLMASQITSVSTGEEVHDELNKKLETMMSMLRLIEVFERVGDKIELYGRYLTKLSREELAAHMACLLIGEGFAEYKDFELKRSISCATMVQFHKDFLELLESKLSGENEGTQLESGTTKIYKQHDADDMTKLIMCFVVLQNTKWIPRLSNQLPNLGAIPILNNEDGAKVYLPLKVSLETLRCHPYLNDWTPKKSIFKLVCILCLPQLKESFESVMDACKTEIETIGCDLARQGMLVELASLLMAAPEKLIITTSPGSNDICSNVIRRCIMSDLQALLDVEVGLMCRSNCHKLVEKCKDKKEMNLSALLVLEVFERAGNSINQYLQSDAYNDGTRSRLEIGREIQNLLEKAGFAMMPKDTDLNDIKCFSPTLDPVDHTSLPLALRPNEFSVAEKKHLFGTQRGLPSTPSVQGAGAAGGLRMFHTMVQCNLNCCGGRVSAPKSKAVVQPGIPIGSRKSIGGWFLYQHRVDISKV